MPWIGGAISAAGSLLGGMMGADASNSAAQAQLAATQAAIDEQRRQYDLTRSDLAPWRDAGSASVNRLKYLMGLGGTNSAADRAALRASLLPKYTTTTKQLTGYDSTPVLSSGSEQGGSMSNPIYSDVSSIDEAGLNAAIDAQSQGSPNDPAYGSLLRDFTMADRDADPVYQSGLQFGLEQGTRGINERAIANGGYDSGATLKALTRFGNDYGTTKAEGAYNRFNTNKTNRFNMLSGLSGTGQAATNSTGAAGQNMTNNISELITGGGNARAAGLVGGANAWSNAFGGVGSAIQGYQNRGMLDRILGNRGGGGNWAGADPNADYTFGF